MTGITAVGGITTTGSQLSGWTGTLSVSPVSVGDLFIAASYVQSASIHYTAMSGGGVTTWQHVGGPFSGTSGGMSVDLWMGVVTATGTSTITGTGSSSLSGVNNGIAVQELTLGGPGIWSVDGSAGTLSNASSTTLPMPTLTPSSAGEVYFGVAMCLANSPSNGAVTSPAGYVTSQLLWNFSDQIFLFNPSLGTGPQTPVMATRASAAVSWSIAALVKGVLPSNNLQLRVISQAVNRASSF